jgi:adenosylcobinamide kinase/adenosylcobinamide-phosphate guanylyltransferase
MLLCSDGFRSGKREFAKRWVEARGIYRVYLATAYCSGDAEMDERIAKHRAARGECWQTFEVAASPDWAEPELWVEKAVSLGDALLFDCLTLWTSLCMEKGYSEEKLLALTKRLLAALNGCGKPVALVTNEVGMGLVPDAAARQSVS